MNAQQIFDTVVAHLREQGCQSFGYHGNGGCAYRGEQNRKCAAGCLIPDHLYDRGMEGSSFLPFLRVFSPLFQECPWLLEHCDLIKALQETHDSISPSHWEKQFQRVAERFSLTYAAA